MVCVNINCEIQKYNNYNLIYYSNLIVSIFTFSFVKAQLDYKKTIKEVYDKTKTYNNALDFKTLTIKEINEKNLTGNYNVKAFVINVNICGPCPPGALCEMCFIEGPTISDTFKKEITEESMKESMRFRTKNPAQFEIGKQYEFSIKISQRIEKNNQKPMIFRDTELLGYNQI